MSVEHIYQQIGGWFDWQDTYRRWVAEVPAGGSIVEVGVFRGKSFAFLAVEALNSGKALGLHAVDTWTGSPEIMRFAGVADGTFYDDWCKVRDHLTKAGACIGEYRRPSIEAAAAFGDGSVDRVWLDGDHSLAGLLGDLEAWWPKVRPGGEIGGHDFGQFEVTPAVERFARRMGRPIEVLEPCPEAGTAHASKSFLLRKPAPVTSWEVPVDRRAVLVCVVCNQPWMAKPTAKQFGALMLHAAHGAQAAGFKVGYHWEDSMFTLDGMRDRAAQHAIDGGYSHILFLDADNVWPHDTLARLLPYHPLGIVGGLYHRKSGRHEPVAHVEAPDDPDPNMFRKMPFVHEEQEPQRVAMIGMGCTLVPTAVFTQMPRPWFKFQYNAFGENQITEDVWFCRQATAVGCPIWIDPTLKLGHVAQLVVGVKQYEPHVAEMAAAFREKARQASLAAAREQDRAWLVARGLTPDDLAAARAAQVARLQTQGQGVA